MLGLDVEDDVLDSGLDVVEAGLLDEHVSGCYAR